MDSSMGEAIVRLIVCLPVVGVLAYLFIKFGLPKNYLRRQGNMQIMEQIALAPKATLSIVKIGNEYLLLAACETGISLIKQMEDYQENEAIQFHFDLSDALKNRGRGRSPHV